MLAASHAALRIASGSRSGPEKISDGTRAGTASTGANGSTSGPSSAHEPRTATAASVAGRSGAAPAAMVAFRASIAGVPAPRTSDGTGHANACGTRPHEPTAVDPLDHHAVVGEHAEPGRVRCQRQGRLPAGARPHERDGRVIARDRRSMKGDIPGLHQQQRCDNGDEPMLPEPPGRVASESTRNAAASMRKPPPAEQATPSEPSRSRAIMKLAPLLVW